jgi:hypothetical protein
MGKVIGVLLFLTLAAAGALFLLSSRSTIAFDSPPKAVGSATPVTVRVTNSHGVRRVTARLEQGGASTSLLEIAKPSDRVQFWRKHAPPEEFLFMAGKDQAPDLKEGKARLVVEVQSNDFRGLTDSVSAEVEVVLRPPTVVADGSQHYINQGGSELVVFTPSGNWSGAGVRVGGRAFRSFPVPGGGEQRFSLFAYSWDTAPDTAPVVYAQNAAATEATASFWFKVFPKRFRARELPLDDPFLTKIANELDAGGAGDLLSRYLKVNRDMRAENNRTLADLRFQTEERFLWTQAFLQLTNSQVESQFADVRTYLYGGEEVDKQVHLGFDLATVRHGPVLAANDGKVIWAKPLGIYGNCIVLDHGYGLQSIYGHLSEFAVKEGDMVTRGQNMGKTGMTGLAGGDHLHFSMQVDGVQINPVEWWDEHWIQDHVWSRVKR